MNKFIYVISILSVLLFSSCSVVGVIFKAGMGVGIFLCVLVVGAIIYFITRSSKKK